jgi:Tol biopolymer transport system component
MSELDPPLESRPDDVDAVGAWLRRNRRHRLTIGLAALAILALAGILITVSERQHSTHVGGLAHVVPLAGEPGQHTSPSFSPDGKQIVYSWSAPGGSGTHLVVRAVAGIASRALSQGDGRDEYPTWSPRGDRIAFERITSTTCSVYIITPDRTGLRRVGDCDFGAAGPMTWTRDGSSLIFSHRPDAINARELISLNVDTGHWSPITQPAVGMPGDMEPALAPNGRRLVFVRSHAVGIDDLSLLDFGAAAVARVTHDNLPLAGVTFDGTSHSVVFASPRGGRFALWRSRLNGTPPELLLASVNELRAPAMSNDGRALAFEEWQFTTDFLQIPDDTSSKIWNAYAAAAALERQPALAPDHRQLAFISNRGGREQLWLAPGNGGEAKILTSANLDYLETPRWSPDGRTIVFAGARGGRFDLWVVTLANGRLKRISSDGASRAPSFSRDGNWLYFATARSGTWQLWRRSWPMGDNAEQLTTAGGLAALESRDGTALYYVRPDRRGLWLRNPTPGGDPIIVIEAFSPADWCNWDLTENTIWFVMRPDSGPPELASYSIENHQVTHRGPLANLLPASGMTIAPDDASVIVTTIASARANLKLATLE